VPIFIVTSKPKKYTDRMTMKFLLQKEKKRKPTPHSGTFGCPTHEQPLFSQKSLHFAFAPKT
jgi:hypothetical protein